MVRAAPRLRARNAPPYGVGVTLSSNHGQSRRTIGPALIQRTAMAGGGEFRPIGEAERLLAGYAALHFLPPGEARGPDGEVLRCRAGDALLAPPGRSWRVAGRATAECVTLLLPRRSLAAALPATGSGWRLLPTSVALDAVAAYVGALALAADALDAEQARLAARALSEMVLAALAEDAAAAPPAPRREVGLLDRAIVVIDRQVGAPLDAAALCRAMGCSRSALYRAAAPAGGVAELIVQRRLAAAERGLSDPGERRSIAELARDLGFADSGRFGRRFKRQFGVTPGDYRRRAIPALADGDA